MCSDIHPVTTNEGVSLSSSVRAEISFSLASQLYNSAIQYTLELERFELLNPSDYETIKQSYEAHSLSVIILCVSALEAKINQFYESSCYQQNEVKSYLDVLRKQGYLISAKYGIVEKYNCILELLQKDPFITKKPKEADYNGNNTQFQTDLCDYDLLKSIIDLITLRNAIVHYNPEIHYDTHEPISMKMYNLFNNRFSPKRGMNRTDLPYFPSQCLGFGSAKWAVTTTFSFWSEYFKRTNVQREIDHFESIRTKISNWL